MQNVNFWSVNYPFKLELVSPFLCFFFPFFISPTLPWSTLSFSIFLPLMSSLLCMSYDNYTLVATEKWQVSHFFRGKKNATFLCIHSTKNYSTMLLKCVQNADRQMSTWKTRKGQLKIPQNYWTWASSLCLSVMWKPLLSSVNWTLYFSWMDWRFLQTLKK